MGEIQSVGCVMESKDDSEHAPEGFTVELRLERC